MEEEEGETKNDSEACEKLEEFDEVACGTHIHIARIARTDLDDTG